MIFDLIPTACGWVGVSFSKKGVRRLNLPVPDKKEALALLCAGHATDLEKSDGIDRLRQQVVDYFNGGESGFNCRLDLSGATPFQRRVWQVVREIPYGQVKSYKWVAERTGRPHACRAVGRALSANPMPLIIPCHRVIRSDGKPGGFGGIAGDVKTKLMLLELEGCRIQF
ncbi:MAG: methylated-DNA--[protein]-cysteine S-methyltransferase [Dehalococcoidia bacterium]